MIYRLIHADVIEGLRSLADCSVDAVVTDPPYGLEFMGKEWDGADGFRRSLNGADANRESVFGRTSRTSPEYRTSGAGQKGKPGIGERATDWVNNQGWNQFRCGACGHLFHGGSPCGCENPKPVRADNRWPVFQQWCEAWAAECLRVLKPGGHLLAFGGSRTYHRMACAIEDAGFEIRDQIQWLYGSGFPKSLDVSKAIDKALGTERTQVIGVKAGHEEFAARTDAHSAGGRSEGWERPWRDDPEAVSRSHMASAPATPEAARWNGYGTALKPAHEPIVVARKPLVGTVAKNVLTHGTGALNIDGCRIEGGPSPSVDRRESAARSGWDNRGGAIMADATDPERYRAPHPGEVLGRWPANVILDEEAADLLDLQTGELTSGVYSGRRNEPKTKNAYGAWALCDEDPVSYGDSGGASRFFFTAKASRSERESGIYIEQEYEHSGPRGHAANGDGTPRPRPRPRGNVHPTVKPISLMRWLVRLVTPRDGTVLDPFMGSGSTGCAAIGEGFDFIGIEREAEYVEIARARIHNVAPLMATEEFDHVVQSNPGDHAMEGE